MCVFKTRVLRSLAFLKRVAELCFFPMAQRLSNPYPAQNQSPGRGQVDPNKAFSKHGLEIK